MVRRCRSEAGEAITSGEGKLVLESAKIGTLEHWIKSQRSVISEQWQYEIRGMRDFLLDTRYANLVPDTCPLK